MVAISGKKQIARICECKIKEVVGTTTPGKGKLLIFSSIKDT